MACECLVPLVKQLLQFVRRLNGHLLKFLSCELKLDVQLVQRNLVTAGSVELKGLESAYIDVVLAWTADEQRHSFQSLRQLSVPG
jgi:hypothetical protein